jgi:hypothetical protein
MERMERMATAIPILKPGKNSTDTESYRPISLTSCLCKILERMVNNKLVYLLPEQEYGFRKGRSTTDVLVILQNNIAEENKNQLPWHPWLYPKPVT